MRQTPLNTLVLDDEDCIVPGTGLGGKATEPEDFGQVRRGVARWSDDSSHAELAVYDSHGDILCHLYATGTLTTLFRQALLVAARDLLDTIDPLPDEAQPSVARASSDRAAGHRRTRR